MKIVFLLVVGIALTIISAFITAPFVYFGWNMGVIAAIPSLRAVEPMGALGLALFVCGIIGAARTSLSLTLKD